MQAKQRKGSFYKDEGIKTKFQIKVVYSDVCEPMQVDSIGGNKYFVNFIDDLNRKLWTYMIKK